jgi:D-aminoacyl-tRNA deacylase
MKALIQRVKRASIAVADHPVADIGPGLLVMVGFEPADDDDRVGKLIRRCIAYRVFADDSGRMNLSLQDCGGRLLLVPQFTLAADTRSGLRPSFSSSAPPALARRLFEHAVTVAIDTLGAARVQQGAFGADMAVSLVNDGPVTFWLETGGPADPAAGR